MSETYTVHLSDNSIDLIRNLAGMICLVKNDGHVPKALLTDAAGYEKLQHAAKRLNKDEWSKGIILGLEILVKDELGEDGTLMICHSKK